jgi:hypothetical protein
MTGASDSKPACPCRGALSSSRLAANPELDPLLPPEFAPLLASVFDPELAPVPAAELEAVLDPPIMPPHVLPVAGLCVAGFAGELFLARRVESASAVGEVRR